MPKPAKIIVTLFIPDSHCVTVMSLVRLQIPFPHVFYSRVLDERKYLVIMIIFVNFA